jgi:phospholipase/lecithinase/hemolysin
MPLFLDLDWLFDGLDFSALLSGLLPVVEASLTGPASPRSLFDDLPAVPTLPPAPAPVLPDNIDWGSFLPVDLATQFDGIVATVNATVNSLVMEYTDLFADLSQWVGNLAELNFANALATVNSLVMEYTDLFADLSQLIGNLPELNFANALTIDVGNTLSDRAYNQLVVFGDSLSDTGNLSQALGGLFPPPPFFDGRLSNGPLWLEYLAPAIGITQVTNLAFAGATSGRSNVASLVAGQDLGKLPGVLDEIDLFANQLKANGLTQANPHALYVVWGGANDFLTLPQAIPDAIQSVWDSVNNVAQAVTNLAGLGAQTIVVPNLPNLGVTPLAAARNLSTNATLFSTLFNTLLQGTLGDLERDLKVDIVQVDVFSLVQSIVARPSAFGLSNLTTPLFQAAVASPTPIDPAKFAFADDFHPTTAVHQLIGEAFQRVLAKPVPGTVLPTSAGLVQGLLTSSGLGSGLGSGWESAIQPLLGTLTSSPWQTAN